MDQNPRFVCGRSVTEGRIKYSGNEKIVEQMGSEEIQLEKEVNKNKFPAHVFGSQWSCFT